MFAIIPVFVLAGAAWLASLLASAFVVAVWLYIIWRVFRAYPVLKARAKTRIETFRSKEE